MVRLGDLAQGRDNNLNLIRMLAATGVLVSHAWQVSLGDSAVQPLQIATGFTLGTLSVITFFAISGFLIAASFERAPSRGQFLAARGLRLFPGLAVSLLLVAFALGPVMSSLPVGAYLVHPEVWSFLARNITLFQPQYTLPGVLVNATQTNIELSIWTLVHEVACYAALFIGGLLGAFSRPRLTARLLVLWIVGYCLGRAMALPLPHRLVAFYGLSVAFSFGTLLYLWRRHVVLSLPVALLLLVLAVLAKNTAVALPVMAVAIGYGTFWAAYVPGGAIRAYNRLGDYSYGLYIYAFPVQSAVAGAFGPMSPLENIAWSLPLTLILAVASWRLVERPALAMRHRVFLPRSA